VFRIAAGPRIGFGHLMRARALARALGVRPVVSVRGGDAAHRAARQTGCRVLSPRQDPCEVASLLVVDDPSPDHTRQWVARAKERQLLTVSIHDGGAGHSNADLVVDASASWARSRGRERVLLGPRFYLLEPRLSACLGRRPPARVRGAAGVPEPVVRPRLGKPDVPRVLVALGGGAHERRVAARLVAAVAARCPAADIAVAPGLVPGRLPRLPGGRWLESPSGLIAALAASDVVVVAGGVTLYEACALGCPTVGMAVVKGQRPAIRALASRGGILDAGGPLLGTATASRVGGAVARLVMDRVRRRRLGRRARRLVDGQGAERVARRIRALASKRGAGRV
jgi:spore coat polysaccharide biosynthesis predicted glycosyltransferase SpsG